MDIPLPLLSLIVPAGCSGSGKHPLARTDFLPTEVLSSDYCRGPAWNEGGAEATDDMYEMLRSITGNPPAAGPEEAEAGTSRQTGVFVLSGRTGA